MKRLSYPLLDEAIEFEENSVNILVIESPKCFRELLYEMQKIARGEDSTLFFSKDYEEYSFAKNVDVIYCSYEMDFNNRKISNRILQDMHDKAIDEEMYVKSLEIEGNINSYLETLIEKLDYEINYAEFQVDFLFKEISPKIETKENTYLENICTYMSFMNCLFKYTTFIFFNLKCFLEEEELEDLYKFSNYNKLDLLLCENVEREKLNFEKITILDKDLCQVT